MSTPDVSEFSIRLSTTIQEAITCIDRSARISIALVLDDDGRLLDTITDGDIRRGLLAGIGLDQPVSKLLPIKARTPHAVPVTAPVGTDPGELLRLMQERAVRQVPMFAEDGKIVDIVILADLLPQPKPGLHAVVMAGGLGMRLRPLTDDLPKPMLSVGGRPLLELTLDSLHRAGVRHVHVSTNYQAEKIIEHFGDGSALGVELSYINEDIPLGTAGALGLMDVPDSTLLVINGDILTHVDLQAMLEFHQEQRAQMTVGVRQYDMIVPYGVVECDGPRVLGLREKPRATFLVNAGVYLLEPSVFAYIPKRQRLDMTDLIQALLDAGRPVMSFPIIEYWMDIGHPGDYEQAQKDAANGKYASFTPPGPVDDD
jgi:dTDP-glucose pyrophosphorylase/CBS domain-containing protein